MRSVVRLIWESILRTSLHTLSLIRVNSFAALFFLLLTRIETNTSAESTLRTINREQHAAAEVRQPDPPLPEDSGLTLEEYLAMQASNRSSDAISHSADAGCQ